MILWVVALGLGAYLLGSIPSAVWIGRTLYRTDVREHGSGNAGATNVLRTLGPGAAAAVLVVDVLKGYAAVALALLLPESAGIYGIYNMKIVLAVAVVLGHIFPVFAGFRGGKGVATLTGAVLGIAPGAVLLCAAVFALVLALWRYVSLASMIAGIMLPVFATTVFHVRYMPLVLFFCLISVLLVVTHRKNISRLLHGTESRIRFRRTSGPDGGRDSASG